MEKLLTISEMAKLTGISESRLREYIDTYSEYFYFTQEALEVIKIISEESRNNKNSDEINSTPG